MSEFFSNNSELYISTMKTRVTIIRNKDFHFLELITREEIFQFLTQVSSLK